MRRSAAITSPNAAATSAAHAPSITMTPRPRPAARQISAAPRFLTSRTDPGFPELFLHRHETGRGRLEVEVIGRRSAAPRAVIEDDHPGAEIRRKPQEHLQIIRERLGKVAAVGDGQVPRKDRNGVAQNEIGFPVEDRPLLRGEMFAAEEAGAPTGSIPDRPGRRC